MKGVMTLAGKFFRSYFNSWWLPFVVMLGALGTFIAGTRADRINPYLNLPDFVGLGLLLLLGLTLVGIPLAAAWNFSRKRWGKGLTNFVAAVLVMIPVVGFCSMAYHFLGPSEDGFADDLTIPQDIEISAPQDVWRDYQGGPGDTFQACLLTAIKERSSGNSAITPALPSLVQLHEKAPGVLRRYLSTSPCWRVFKEKGAVFAARRWVVGYDWLYEMHGYYSRFSLGLSPHDVLPDFNSRVTLGLSSKPWARLSDESICIQYGQTLPLTIAGNGQKAASHCVITCGELVVELFERSQTGKRVLTEAALLHIEEELLSLASSPQFSTIRSMLPPDSIKNGQSTIELFQSHQPGIYDSQVWVNPGEPGMIYFKAYELTQNTRLSTRELDRYSNEWVGWSDDPSELFFSNTHFTIFEGDWGKPYAARFEVWFVPDSGEPERKLTERLFKIEGWQR